MPSSHRKSSQSSSSSSVFNKKNLLRTVQKVDHTSSHRRRQDRKINHLLTSNDTLASAAAAAAIRHNSNISSNNNTRHVPMESRQLVPSKIFRMYFNSYFLINSGSLEKDQKNNKKDQIEPMDINDIEIIDLCTPVNETAAPPAKVMTRSMSQLSVASSSSPTTTTIHNDTGHHTTTTLNQTSYQSRTLTPLNCGRHSILPAFPASYENEQPDLLLANVPSK